MNNITPDSKLDGFGGEDAATGSARNVERWEPMPYFSILLVVLFGVFGWIAISSGGSAVLLSAIIPATIYAIFATGVGFLIRQNGWVSFGHAVYFGMPAYLVGTAFASDVVSAEVAVIGAILVTGLSAFLIGLVIGRVSGIALSMLTLAIGQAFYEWAMRSRPVGGSDGLTVDVPDPLFGLPGDMFFDRLWMFAFCWVALLGVVVIVEAVTRSRFGTLTEAIRDNEERVRFLGYRTLVNRAAIYALSAGITGVAGVLLVISNGFISPDTLHWSTSGTGLVMALLGGFTRTWGPLIGAVTYMLLRNFVGDATEHWLAIIGAGLIVIIVIFPAGLSGLIMQALAGIARLSDRRSRSQKRVSR